jgi:hypothetical protein
MAIINRFCKPTDFYRDNTAHLRASVTYMNTASFSLYLVPALIKHIISKRNSEKRGHE